MLVDKTLECKLRLSAWLIEIRRKSMHWNESYFSTVLDTVGHGFSTLVQGGKGLLWTR